MACRGKVYVFPRSNSVLKTRLMIEYKVFDYGTVKPMPGPRAFIMLGLGFETTAVPGVKIDGHRAPGTGWIAHGLDESFPERPSLPGERARRKAVQDVGRWGEAFQNATRDYGGHLRRVLPPEWLAGHHANPTEAVTAEKDGGVSAGPAGPGPDDATVAARVS